MEATVPQTEATRPRPAPILNEKPRPRRRGSSQFALNPSPEKPSGAEAIIYTGLEYVEIIIAAKVHRVKFDLGGPVVPQSILGTDANHPPTGGPVGRDRTEPRDIHTGAGVDPGPARLAIDKPTIEGVTDPGSQRGDPIDARVRRPHAFNVRAAPYGRPRELPFDAQQPLIDLVVVPDLTAADQTTAAAIEPPRADMNAGIEPGPVVDQGDSPVGRNARHIGGVGYDGRRREHRRGKTQLDQPACTHLRSPPVKQVLAHKVVQLRHQNCGTVAKDADFRGVVGIFSISETLLSGGDIAAVSEEA